MESGSESPNLRMAVRVRPESRQNHARITIDRLRSGIGLVSNSDQRGSTPRRPASAASSSPGGEAGFIRRTCRVRSPGLLRRSERRLTGGCAAARIGTWRADHLGVIAVTHAARAGFDSLARYLVPLAQRQVWSPDERSTEVRVLHGTRPHGVRSVMVAREFVNLVARVRFPPYTQQSRARLQACPVVPKSSGEDARLSTAIGEFDPRRDRSRGGMCQGGELHLQCGCGRFDSGPLHDLQISTLPSW